MPNTILLVGGPFDGERRPNPQEKWLRLHFVERLPKMPILDYDPKRPTTIPFTIEHYKRITLYCNDTDDTVTFYAHSTLETQQEALAYLLDHYKKE